MKLVEKRVYINRIISSKTDDVTRPFGGALMNAASTTGNITGIYDIHGSAAEFVAAYVNGGSLTDGGFTSDPASTYGNE